MLAGKTAEGSQFIERRFVQPVEVPVWQEELIDVTVEHIHPAPVPVEELRPRPTERVIKALKPCLRAVDRPVEYDVDRLRPRPVEVELPRVVNRYRECPVEREVERRVAVRCRSEKPRVITREVDVPCTDQREVLKTTERVVEQPFYVDVELEKVVEVIVEKEVLVPVEHVIEVPVEVFVEVPEVTEVLVEEEVVVEVDVPRFGPEVSEEVQQEVFDAALQNEIDRRNAELIDEQRSNEEMRRAHAALFARVEKQRALIADPQVNVAVLGRYMQLLSKLRNAENENRILRARPPQRVTEQFVKECPRSEYLRSRLQSLLKENAQLIAEAKQSRSTASVVRGGAGSVQSFR